MFTIRLYIYFSAVTATVTTRSFTFLVGNPSKHLFATVIALGVDPTFIHIKSCIYRAIAKYMKYAQILLLLLVSRS